MLVTAELFLNNALYIMDTHFVKLKIMHNDKLLEESESEDVFQFFGTALPGKRIAAIGRKRRYDSNYLLGRIFEADEANPAKFLWLDPEDEIKLIIKTNIWLDPGIMLQELTLKISSDKKNLEIPLNRPDIKINWPSRGTFEIDIGDYIRELYAARIAM